MANLAEILNNVVSDSGVDITTLQPLLTNPVTGTGTTNYVPKWTGTTALGNSLIQDDGTNVAITGTKATIGPATTYNTFNGTQLQIYDATASKATRIFMGNTNYGPTGIYGLAIGYTNATAYINNSDNGPLYFYTNGTLNFGIFNNGNVLIQNGGSYVNAGYRLDVTGTFRSTLDANINGLTVGKGGGTRNFLVTTGGANITTAQDNMIVGDGAGNSLNTGWDNTLLGKNAGRSITSGSQNTIVGLGAGQNLTTGLWNVFVGIGTAQTNRSSYNIFIGPYSGYGDGTTTTGNRNIGIGYESLGFNTSGTYNTSLGNRSGYDITTGQYNTILGAGTVGNGITTGSFNTIIGSQITGLSSSLSNTIILADGQGNQRLYINNSGQVGIGTQSPSAPLHISRTDGASLPVTIRLTNTAGSSTITNNPGNLDINNAGGAWTTTFSKGGDEIMRISASNNLLIGTTTDAGYKLDVNGTARVQNNSGLTLALGTSTAPTFWSGYNSIFFGVSSSLYAVNNSNDAGMWVNAVFDGTNFRRVRTGFGGGFGFNNNGEYTLSLYDYAVGAVNITTAQTDNALFAKYGVGVVINEDGKSTIDFRIEGDTNANLFFTKASTDNIGMGTNSPNASALLDVSSTTKGILFPRMTSTQRAAISTPAVGLIVYQTDATEGTYEYTSSGWRVINQAGGSTAYSVISVTTTHTETATSGTKIIKADTTGGAFTINLPTAVSNTATIIIKKTAGSGALTVDGNGTQTIDGGLTAVLNEIGESITLISDNSNWQIV